MDFAWRRLFFLLLLILASAAATSATGPPAKVTEDEPAAEYADPKTTYGTFLEAVRKNDIKAGKRCWVIDDDNKSGALDTIVGLWISMRRINQVAEKKFGAEGLDALNGWRRNDITDAALDLTKKRLGNAKADIIGDTAKLEIRWEEGDSGAFNYGSAIRFRKVGGNWKIDANKMTGLRRGVDLFEPASWGRLFRDQVAIMNQAIDGMEKGTLKTTKELTAFIEGKIDAVRKKYEEETKKYIEEKKKRAPKGE